MLQNGVLKFFDDFVLKECYVMTNSLHIDFDRAHRVVDILEVGILRK